MKIGRDELCLYGICFINMISLVYCLGGSTGITYMDSLNSKRLNPGEDICNPLYWYPRSIPEICLIKISVTPKYPKNTIAPRDNSIPVFPVFPVPPPVIMPIPPPQILPLMPIPPNAIVAPPSVHYGIQSSNSILHIVPQNRVGMVPGLPGIVSRDGGINIMPFSDAYADILEEHKNKMIRRKLRKILNKYDYFGNSRNFKRRWSYLMEN